MIRISIAEAGKSPQLLTFNADVVTLGRASSHELCLTGKGVSGTHCRLLREGNAYFVEDLGSTNGTYVNRHRVQGRQGIGPTDDVVLAIYRLRVLADSESGVSARPLSGPFPAAPLATTGEGPVVATPGVRRAAPTAHVAPPTGAPPSMQPMPPSMPPGQPSMQPGPPSMPPGQPPMQPGQPSMQPGQPSMPPMQPGQPSVPPMQPGQPSVQPAMQPAMQSVPPSMQPAPPASTPSQPGALSTSGRSSAASSRRPDDMAWEREWEQIEKLANAWLASGRSRGALLRGEKLAHARKWFAQGRAKRPAPTRLHRDFIVAGKRARGLRVFGGLTLGTVALAGIGVGGWFGYQTIQAGGDHGADDDGTVAVGADLGGGVVAQIDPLKKGDRKASDALAAEVDGVLAEKPVLALLLATEAVAMLPPGDTDLDAPAYAALRKALRPLPGRPLRGHSGSLAAVALSPDGRWAVTSEGGRSTNVRLWDLNKPGVLQPKFMRGHPRGVSHMMVSRDGRWLVTADGDGLAQRWSLREPDPSAAGVQLDDHQFPISAMDLSADGRWLVTGDEGGHVTLWDLDQSLPRGTSLPRPHEGKVTGVSITDNGSRVISSGEDMTARNWRLTDGRPGRAPLVVPHEELPVTAVDVAGDDSQALTGTGNGTVLLWNPTSRAPARKWEVLESHRRAVTHLEVSADASVAVSAAADSSLVAWDLRAKVPSASSVGLPGHSDRIIQLQIFSMPANVPPGRRAPNTAFTASADGTARSWNLDRRRSGIESRVFSGHVGGVRSVAVSGDGQWAITGGEDGVARVWDWQSLPLEGKGEGLPEIGSASLVARGHAQGVVGAAVDRFGRRMITGSADGTARVWDLRNDVRVLPLPVKELHEGPVRALAISPNAKYGATGDDSGTLAIWDISEDIPLGRTFSGHTGEIGQVEFTAGGRTLVSVSTDRSARVWRLGRNPEDTVVVLPHDDEVTRMSLSEDGRWLLTGTLTKAVLWDLGGDDPTKPERSFKRHEDDITAVGIDAKGRWVATGGADRIGFLYDLEKRRRKKPFPLRRHEGTIGVISFQPTGRWLATGSDDKSIRLWDLDSDHPNEQSQVLTGHKGGITDLEWSPDGQWLVSSSNDGTIRMWDTRKEFIEMVEQSLVFEGHMTDTVISQIGLLPGEAGRGLTRLVSAGYDGTARVWPLQADPLVKLGCTRAGRPLTTEEWDQYIGGGYDPSC